MLCLAYFKAYDNYNLFDVGGNSNIYIYTLVCQSQFLAKL